MTIPINGTALHVFPLPLLAMLWGIALGAIGSSTGDVHYGAESEYQKFEFGGGTPVAIQGDIVTKAPLGAKNSMDVVNFCAKFGGPLTGFCFGLVVFFSFWNTVVFYCRYCNYYLINCHGQLLRSICKKPIWTI